MAWVCWRFFSPSLLLLFCCCWCRDYGACEVKIAHVLNGSSKNHLQSDNHYRDHIHDIFSARKMVYPSIILCAPFNTTAIHLCCRCCCCCCCFFFWSCGFCLLKRPAWMQKQWTWTLGTCHSQCMWALLLGSALAERKENNNAFQIIHWFSYLAYLKCRVHKTCTSNKVIEISIIHVIHHSIFMQRRSQPQNG